MDEGWMINDVVNFQEIDHIGARGTVIYHFELARRDETVTRIAKVRMECAPHRTGHEVHRAVGITVYGESNVFAGGPANHRGKPVIELL